MRGRIWRDRSHAYVCAFCRHNTLGGVAKSYSSSSNPSPISNSQPGSLGTGGNVHNWTSPRASLGPTAGSSWGTPRFAPKQTASNNGAPGNAVDELLPHERAARERLTAKQEQPPPPPPPPDRSSRFNQRRAEEVDKTPPTFDSLFKKMGLGDLPESLISTRLKKGLNDTRRPRTTNGKLDETLLDRSDSPRRAESGASNEWGLLQRKNPASLPGNGQRQRGLGEKIPGHTSSVDPFEAAFASRIDSSAKSRPFAKADKGKSSQRDFPKKPAPLRGQGLLGGLDSKRSGGSDSVDPFESAFASRIDSSAKARPSARAMDTGNTSEWDSPQRRAPSRGRGLQGGLDEPSGRGSNMRSADRSSSRFESWPEAGNSRDATGTGDFWSQLQSRVARAPSRPENNSSSGSAQWDSMDLPRNEQREEQTRRKTTAFSESYEISRDPRRRGDAGHGGEVSSRKSKKSASRRRSRNEEDDENWDEASERKDEERRLRKAERKAHRARGLEPASLPTIFLPEFISIYNLAIALKMKPAHFLRAIEEMGFEDITEDSIVTGETAAIVAMEFGFDPTVDTGGARDLKPRPPPEDMSALPPRPPVVTIMGHVDHGKTTLLDWLRKSSVAAQEHGGITQHIGAFMVKMSSGKPITFLDTPGHAAFLTMRQRGANITDIVVLVVAADDSVKPQTLEALKHARAAKVPIIVAINKIDKEDARPDQVKADLARHGVEIEDFGGDVQVVSVSGKTGKGMDELEENIVLLSEVLDMRAEKDGMSEGWVLESSIKQVGKSATVLVKRGTLRPGDFIIAGTTWARIRSLRSEAGVDLEEAPPGTPVEIVGWRDLPAAGDQVLQAPDEDKARTAVEYREEMRYREESSRQLVEQEQRERDRIAAAEAEAAGEEQSAGSSVKTVNFIVKGDVHGSVEAVCATILEIGNNEVKPRILQFSAGQVSESDVEYAAVSNSVIVNFNNAIPGHVKSMADDKRVKVIDHTVIYHLADDVKAVLSEQLGDTITSKVIGEAEVAQVFPINVKARVFKNIAGCKIRNGSVSRNASVRILRKGEKIFDGKIESLKQGKKDVAEMRKGTECGIAFDAFQDFEVGDQIQTYEEVREKRSL